MAWAVYEIVLDEDFKEMHVVPEFGPAHLMRGLGCWCKPKQDPTWPNIVVHNAEN